MGRLIIVSNRVNPPSSAGDESVGGLAMALAAALRGGSGLWFGWTGKTASAYSGQLKVERIGGVMTATIDLDEAGFCNYYNGYSNKTLWPLLHYRPDLAVYDRDFQHGYQLVNERFADALAPLVEPNDLIWIHDYHLIPLGRELRRRGFANRIGFFLHVPWPAAQVFVNLPEHRELVQALFAYDLLGFQIQDYLQAFEDYVVSQAAGRRTEEGMLSAFDRSVETGVFPIGIDAPEFARLARTQTARSSRERLIEATAGRRLIVGVDRLDYSKGMEERFLGFERFLADHAELRSKVLMLQIAPVSREQVLAYQEIRSRLDALSGRINGEYSDVDWTPLRYVNKSYRRDELAGIYAASCVGLVTPLRDGMNLVAKEYVAAQDSEDPGVLILSQFTGAARELDAALLVNPNSREEVADALRRALAMDRHERTERWQALYDVVSRNDVQAWRDSFVARLRATRGLAIAA